MKKLQKFRCNVDLYLRMRIEFVHALLSAIILITADIPLNKERGTLWDGGLFKRH